ncbi:concanavalin A-like lectin/glucanase domain-containing protein [Cladochytrium replicatum]|nr:concanavalin A-like lectin/glucanase domain-containing protein [Cladochytrium replicatum]
MFTATALSLVPFLVFPAVFAQQVGTAIPEHHPHLQVASCTRANGCTPIKAEIVLDLDSRQLTLVDNPSVSCFDNNGNFNRTICTDAATCAKKCAAQGFDYTNAVETKGTSLKLKQLLRYYLLENENAYMLLKLKNREFSFDVNMNELTCGWNGALYLSEMSRTNETPAGPKYGTGYCDAQCPPWVKWANGIPNVEGQSGACCAEMDFWEANRYSTAVTPHVCINPGQFRCYNQTLPECNSCDKGGCGFNHYREGNKTYYGPGLVVDTSKPFSVVTQFVTSDGTDAGDLTEIRRLYIQDNKVIQNSKSHPNDPSATVYDSINDSYCTGQRQNTLGGLKNFGQALDRGMVLVFSLWGGVGTGQMTWLDSGNNGPCQTGANNTNPTVEFFNVKWGEIGSTSPLLTPPKCIPRPTNY